MNIENNSKTTGSESNSGAVPREDESIEEEDDDDLIINKEWDMSSPLIPPRGGSRQNQSLFLPTRNGDKSQQGDGEDFDSSSGLIEIETSIDPMDYYLSTTGVSCTMLFIFLDSGSFFFPWSDTVVRLHFSSIIANDSGFETGNDIKVDWPIHVNAKFQDTLGIFQSSQSTVMVLLIIISTIFIPLLSMSLQSYLVYTIFGISSFRHNSQNRHTPTDTIRHKRIGTVLTFLEYAMKYSMLIVFVHSILNVCTSNVKLVLGDNYEPSDDDGNISSTDNNGSFSDNDDNNSNTSHEHNVLNQNFIYADVINYSRGGLISYMVGLSCFGFFALSTLRRQWYMYHFDQNNDDGDDDENIQMLEQNPNSQESLLDSSTRESKVFSPPPGAFKQRQGFLPHNQSNLSEDESFLMGESSSIAMDDDDNVGNEEIVPLTTNTLQHDTLSSTIPTEKNFALNEESMDSMLLRKTSNMQESKHISSTNILNEQKRCASSRLLEILQFESGLLSFLLMPPLSTIPLIRLEYTGLLNPIFDSWIVESKSMNLLDLTSSIILSNHNGKDVFSFLTIAFFFMNVIIIPAILWICCTIIWLLSFCSCSSRQGGCATVMNGKLHRIVSSLKPFALVTPFAISLFGTLMSLHEVTDYLFNKNITCDFIQSTFGLDSLSGSEVECMSIQGNILTGSYVLLLQGIFTDLFVLFTSIKNT